MLAMATAKLFRLLIEISGRMVSKPILVVCGAFSSGGIFWAVA
jgi:hypothetical protein